MMVNWLCDICGKCEECRCDLHADAERGMAKAFLAITNPSDNLTEYLKVRQLLRDHRRICFQLQGDKADAQ